MDAGTKFSNHFNKNAEWLYLYGGMREEIELNSPSLYGKPINITRYVDSNCAGYKLMCCSHTFILIFVNYATIVWYTKRQATSKSSTCWSASVSLRTYRELIKILRYKLRVIVVLLSGHSYAFSDNKGIVDGESISECNITKKGLGMFYHAGPEDSAQEIWWVGFLKGKHNITDLLTKILYSTAR